MAPEAPTRGIPIKDVLGDFRNFLFLVWQFLGLPEPTEIQYEIADWLQQSVVRDKKTGLVRIGVQAGRGEGKSWITSALVCWILLRDPQANVMVVSASKNRADDFSTFTLRLIHDMPILKHLTPGDDQRQSKISFDVRPALASHAPSVKSIGVFGQMTGSRATYIICDDVEVANNSATQMAREKLLKTVLETEPIATANGAIIYLGTPQTEDSIYTKLRERGYKFRMWPARVPAEEKLAVYAGCLAPSVFLRVKKGEVGEPVDPGMFTSEVLSEREAAMGRSMFALQYMLDTSLSDAERYPLKLKDLVVMPLNPHKAPVTLTYGSGDQQRIGDIQQVGFDGDMWVRPMFWDSEWTKYTGTIMAIDPSGRGSDELAYAVVSHLHGYLFVLDVGGMKGGYTGENLVSLAHIAKQYMANEIIVESNFGDGMFTELLKPVLRRIHNCAVEEVRHHTQKEARIIDTLEPVMNQHRLIVDEGLARRDVGELIKGLEIGADTARDYSLFHQLTRITRQRGALKHDDRLDALAIAVGYWVESMAMDANEAKADYEREQIELELEKFMDHSISLDPLYEPEATPMWVD